MDVIFIPKATTISILSRETARQVEAGATHRPLARPPTRPAKRPASAPRQRDHVDAEKPKRLERQRDVWRCAAGSNPYVFFKGMPVSRAKLEQVVARELAWERVEPPTCILEPKRRPYKTPPRPPRECTRPRQFVDHDDRVVGALRVVEERLLASAGRPTRTSQLLHLRPYPGSEGPYPDSRQEVIAHNQADAGVGGTASPSRTTQRPQSAPPTRLPGDTASLLQRLFKRPYSGGSAALYLRAQEDAKAADGVSAYGRPGSADLLRYTSHVRVPPEVDTGSGRPPLATHTAASFQGYPADMDEDLVAVLERNKSLGRDTRRRTTWNEYLHHYHAYTGKYKSMWNLPPPPSSAVKLDWSSVLPQRCAIADVNPFPKARQQRRPAGQAPPDVDTGARGVRDRRPSPRGARRGLTHATSSPQSAREPPRRTSSAAASPTLRVRPWSAAGKLERRHSLMRLTDGSRGGDEMRIQLYQATGVKPDEYELVREWKVGNRRPSEGPCGCSRCRAGQDGDPNEHHGPSRCDTCESADDGVGRSGDSSPPSKPGGEGSDEDVYSDDGDFDDDSDDSVWIDTRALDA